MDTNLATIGLIVSSIIAVFAVACGGDDSENPDITPATIELETVVGTGHDVEFAILNPSEVERTFDMTTSSSLLVLERDEITVSARESEDITVFARCPDNAGLYREFLEIHARHRSQHFLLEFQLTCHPVEDESP